MNKLQCDYCHKPILKTTYALNRAKNHFCSAQCRHKFQYKPNIIIDKITHAEILIKRNNKEFKVLISKEDVEKVKQIKWNLKFDPTINNYYVQGHTRGVKEKDRKTYSLQRFLFGFPSNMEIDHINRNPLDNRRENLRCVSPIINKNNKGFYSNNKTGYKYIHFSKSHNCYKCEIKRYKKIIFCKSCKNLEKLVKLRNQFIKDNQDLWNSN